MNVFDNIGYSLKMRNVKREIIHEKVIASSFSINHILKQYPGTMSGGERQRTALARTLIMNPEILLLDKPFSALDSATKRSMYQELFQIHKEFRCTIILVTHSFEEASDVWQEDWNYGKW